MQVNKVKFNPSFQKKLVATAGVLKDSEPCPVSIYKITKKDDKDYFEKLSADEQWGLSTYLENTAETFKYYNLLKFLKRIQVDFYAVEDVTEKCLGFVVVNDTKKDKQNIIYIEAIPENSKKRGISHFLEKEKLKYNYIGETMLSFLVKKQQNNKKPKQIVAEHIVLQARNFYLKSNFRLDDEDMYIDSMHLPVELENLLISENENHTKSKIKFVGGKNVK